MATEKPKYLEVICAHTSLLCLSSLVLDMGVMFFSFLIPIVAFWSGVIFMVIRVRNKLGPREIRAINNGSIPIIFLGAVIVSVVIMYRRSI